MKPRHRMKKISKSRDHLGLFRHFRGKAMATAIGFVLA